MKKASAAVFIFAFVLAGAAGAAYSGALMGHDSMTGMVGCPLMGHSAAVCEMDIFEHIGAWQSMFASILAQGATALLMLLLAALALSAFGRFLPLPHPPPLLAFAALAPDVRAEDPVRRLLARGLMHPKVF